MRNRELGEASSAASIHSEWAESHEGWVPRQAEPLATKSDREKYVSLTGEHSTQLGGGEVRCRTTGSTWAPACHLPVLAQRLVPSLVKQRLWSALP
jgi:hypothetical protein